MAEETNIAKIKLSSEDGRLVEAQLQFTDSHLSISDELIMPIALEAGFEKLTSCSITLGVYNIAVSIQNYTLTDTIYIDNFYNMPSYISILQVLDTNIHIVKQQIELFQADCKSILLADCKIEQLDVGLSKHSEALRVKSETKDDKMPTVYPVENIDIRSCKINSMKAYISCNNINVQESSMGTFNLYGGFGSTAIAEIKKLNIWRYSSINTSEIYCTISEFTLSESTINNLIAKAYCKIVKFNIEDSSIVDAHCFRENTFDATDIDAWFLIGKSAEHNKDVSEKNKAYYNISKLKHKQDKGIRKLSSGLFGLCSGYGYKPMRALLLSLVIIMISSATMTLKDVISMGCVGVYRFGENLIISFAALAGQSGLKIENGFAFWVCNVEYICSVVLFAVFVNALYVRYKD